MVFHIFIIKKKNKKTFFPLIFSFLFFFFNAFSRFSSFNPHSQPCPARCSSPRSYLQMLAGTAGRAGGHSAWCHALGSRAQTLRPRFSPPAASSLLTRRLRGCRGPMAQYLQGAPWARMHTVIHTEDLAPTDGHSRAGAHGAQGGAPFGTHWWRRGHWTRSRTADGRGARDCLHLSRIREQGAVLHVQCQLRFRTATPWLCPTVGTGMALAPGVLLELCSGTRRRSGTQPNKLEVGWEGGAGRRVRAHWQSAAGRALC